MRWGAGGRLTTTSLAVLLSGAGSLFQSLLDATLEGRLPARIAVVVSDRADAQGLERARAAGVPTQVVEPHDHPNRAEWDLALRDAIAEVGPEWVVSAGFMRILGPAVLSAFPGRIVNSHPALLPAFPGAHAVRDALDYGVPLTGCTVHLVDAGVDTGPIIAQAPVPVLADDDEASLHERIKQVERDLLVDVMDRLMRHGCTVTGRRVSIP